MWFRMLANQTEETFVTFLEKEDKSLAVREMDVSYCIVANPDTLLQCIRRCTMLRKLYCVACPFKASDMLSLLLQLPFLTRLHFSLVAEHDLAGDMTSILAQYAQGHTASSLRNIYAEVRDDSNFALLEAFVSCCPNLSDLHVHFMRGQLSHAVLYCEEIIEALSTVKNFTFSSDVPACLQLEIPAALDLKTCLQICSNVVYGKLRCRNYNCAQLADLASGNSHADLPPQLVILAIYKPELLAQRIRTACRMLRWTSVSRLCLVLVPQEPECTDYPTVGVEFLPCLREFFVTAVSNLLELNVNSFHFGLDLDLTTLMLNANMKTLRAISAPPCGLRHPSVLQRLVHSCPALEELDVRVYHRASLVRCVVCESPFALHADDVAFLNSDSPRKQFRITLCDLPRLESLRFLHRCSVTDLRLLNCPETVREDYASLAMMLPHNNNLRYLQLQQEWLPLCDESFITNLTCLQSLEYVCFLTGVFASDEFVDSFLHGLDILMRNLKVAHVHYRRPPEGAQQRVTWMRNASWPRLERGHGHVLRDQPCVLCSTATFIGLAKPPTTEINVAP
ncbi:uncharacterized protein LOC119383657 isoform X2 [Rhipicephalus sanguineus]|uniref:uncharacterized protein LOC119383657 isoform X2 n=1 Tax=Rhipicephalus sanguineus TaxID=34632 RepID=UPI0020C2E16D|nr:uncharacterized protein LOC119383657 isoform X2 [Rhipicephalus sanguineus]